MGGTIYSAQGGFSELLFLRLEVGGGGGGGGGEALQEAEKESGGGDGH